MVVVAGGYIFQKAGFAGADFLHVGADVAAGFDSHVGFQHAVDLVVDEYVANLRRRLRWCLIPLQPDHLCDKP